MKYLSCAGNIPEVTLKNYLIYYAFIFLHNLYHYKIRLQKNIRYTKKEEEAADKYAITTLANMGVSLYPNKRRAEK